MEQCEMVLGALDGMGIGYQLIEHPAVFTTEEADKYVEGIEGVRTKTLFLSNKKNTAHYLLVMDGAKRLDMKRLELLIPDRNIHFCSPERLMSKLGLFPGGVSLFGLLNNAEKDVKVLLDRAMLHERFISFHPNVNTRTAIITMDDMFRFIEESGFSYTILDL